MKSAGQANSARPAFAAGAGLRAVKPPQGAAGGQSPVQPRHTHSHRGRVLEAPGLHAAAVSRTRAKQRQVRIMPSTGTQYPLPISLELARNWSAPPKKWLRFCQCSRKCWRSCRHFYQPALVDRPPRGRAEPRCRSHVAVTTKWLHAAARWAAKEKGLGRPSIQVLVLTSEFWLPDLGSNQGPTD